MNKATLEMDKVTQQNAANAEESASAAEEMNAQANQMMDFVEELVKMVGGSSQGGDGLKQLKQSAHQALMSRKMIAGLAGKASNAKAAISRKATMRQTHHDNTEDDFRDF